MREGKYVVMTIAVAAAFAIAMPGIAYGGLLLSESFDYDAGDLAGENGGTGWANAWSGTWSGAGSVASPGLTYAGLTTSGNALATGGIVDGGSLAWRNPGGSVSSGSVWLSFLVKGPQGSGVFNGFSLYTGTSERLFFGGGGDGTLGLAPGDGGFAWTSTGVSFDGNTRFVVGRIDFGAGTGGKDVVHMWVDPNPGMAPLDSAGVSAEQNHYVYDKVRLGGNSAGSVYFDEIKIGTTYADVAGVPEPGSCVLLASGLIGLLAYAWRRRR